MSKDQLKKDLQELGPIAMAGMLRNAFSVMKDSESLGQKAKQLARDIRANAESFGIVQGKAKTDDEKAMMQAVLTELMTELSQPSYQVTPKEKAIIVPLLKAVGFTAADFG